MGYSSESDRPRVDDGRRWWTLSVLCLSLLMVVVGNTVLNIALPTLVRRLNASSTQLQWMVDAYALVFAGLLFTGGALGDRFGRKGALMTGLATFGLASTGAAVSSSPGQLIAARAVMGAAAALVMPATLSILTSVFPPEERGKAIGLWAGVAGAGLAVGPVTSGYLLAHFWWGSVFLVNVPVVVVALAAGAVLVPTSRDPGRTPLDPVGAAFSIVAMSTLVYAIIQAPERGWGDSVIVECLIASAVVLAGFVAWELRSSRPMLDLRFFLRQSFTGGSVAISATFFVLFGEIFLLTQYFQFVRGYSTLEAGLAMLPMALTLMVVAPLSARVVALVGTRRTVVSGLCVVAVSMVVLSRAGATTGYPLVALALLLLAVGLGLTTPPSTGAIMSSIPRAKAGVGSAMNDTTRELGGALGVAVLGSVVASRYVGGLRRTLTGLPQPVGAAARKSVGAALSAAHTVNGAAGVRLAAAARVSFADAMRVASLVSAAAAIVGAVVLSRLMPTHVVHGGGEKEAAADAVRPAPDAVLGAE